MSVHSRGSHKALGRKTPPTNARSPSPKQDMTTLDDPPNMRRKSTVVMGDTVEDLHDLINDSADIQPEARLNMLRNLRRGPQTNREHREESMREETEVLQEEYAALHAALGSDAPETKVAFDLLASLGAAPAES